MPTRRPSRTRPAAFGRAQAPPSTGLSPVGASRLSLRETLLRTLPGRLLVISLAVKALTWSLQLAMALPTALRVLNGAASVGLLVALGYFAWRAGVGVQRRLLWRVRRKLILSYVFIGFVPTLLILAFSLFGVRLMFMNMSAYLFKAGYDDLVVEVRGLARETATELAAPGARPQEVIDRRVAGERPRFADVSMALLAAADGAGAEAGPGPSTAPRYRSGPWWHAEPPGTLPGWLSEDGFAGSLAFRPDAGGEDMLGIRIVVPPTRPGPGYVVVVDLPLSGQVIEHLYDVTGVRGGAVTIGGEQESEAGPSAAPPAADRPEAGESDEISESVTPLNFEYSVAFLEYVDWATGHTAPASIGLNARVGQIYDRISAVQGVISENMTLGQVFLVALVMVAALFLIIEVVALVMGFTLARSITSSVHELFMGTERVRDGDFTHRIRVKTRDQLGELADSFNQMTSSIEDLLIQAAEKKRLEEELRIAREIQMSLLPDGPLHMPGITVAALCVPAREVGGDYYDFFRLGERRVGILIADVAGKGTSAALYMAELKGLVLSLSQVWTSPRQLLVEANRILAANLDSRAFITMTYAVFDLEARRMTYARAGHTPLIYVPANGGGAQVLTPNGMVVGLRIPGAEEKFTELLEERTLPLETDDVFVLYTDGISEAMNPQSDLFGDARLSHLIEEHGHLESGELRERILREVQAFADGADQHDDMTMVLIRVEAEAGRAVAAGAVVTKAAAEGGVA